jgi:formylglycine-generating enzyme required for sulfatase activity
MRTVLTLSDAERVDAACDRFENDWRGGAWPCIEGYLDAVAEPARTVLFDELLELEIELRLEKGESPTAREYRRRFPDHAEAIEAIFAEERRPGSLRSTNSIQVGPQSPSGAEALTSGISTVGMGPEEIHDLPEVDGALGRVVGEYVILDRIGSGGMGVVYRALQRSADRVVALKLIKADWWGESTDDSRRAAAIRFKNEAQTHARLEHDHIVPVYDVGHADGLLFFSMRLIKGRSLAQIIRSDGPLPPRRAAYYLEAIARAIQYAHDHAVVHRDVKPGNIMIGEADRPYLIDLGLAKSLEATDYTTLTGKALGTPEYMSPEQARGDVEIGRSSDVYGLGATLFSLLTGRPPFTGPSPPVVLRKVIDEEPAWPRELNKPVGRELKAICLKCLEKDPSRRFQSAGQLGVVLNKYLNYEATGVTLPAPWTWVVKWVRRQPWRAVAAGFALLALIVLCSAMALRAHHNRVMTASLVHDIRTLPLAELSHTVTLLGNYRNSVIPKLHEMLAEGTVGSELRTRALLALLPFEPKRVGELAEQLVNDNETTDEHRVIREALRSHWSDLAPRLQALLADPAASPAARTRAATGLIALDSPTTPAGRAAWSELQFTEDSGTRTALLDWLVRSRVDPGVLASRLEIESDLSVQRQLIQALGGLGDRQPPAGAAAPLVSRLKTLYRDHPDPGVHSSIAYLLRRWGMGSDVKLIDARLAGKAPAGRAWYVNSLGMTMAIVVPGNGRPHSIRPGQLPARFAIATTETLLALFQEFDPTHAKRRKREYGVEPVQGPDLPADVVSYFEAARFCNWLSEREHIPRAEWCYEPGKVEGVMVLAADYHARRGYRLPTFPEWEYAARAGTTTDRYFGEELAYIDGYVWHRNNTANHPEPVGILRPNDFGLFDAIGNVAEWCYNPNPNPSSHQIQGTCLCKPGRISEQCSARPQTLAGSRFNELPNNQRIHNVNAFYDNTPPGAYMVYSGLRVVKNGP